MLCRYCQGSRQVSVLLVGPVCNETECRQHAENTCTITLTCGHRCAGTREDETSGSCPPCLRSGCRSRETEAARTQDSDEDMCMICFTEPLGAAPVIQLECKHIFHKHCCDQVLSKRWPGPRITFGFAKCALCKTEITHWSLKSLLGPLNELLEDIRRKSVMRLEYEGLNKSEEIITPGARFYQNPAAFAVDRYAYCLCSKCKKAYYGGLASCEEMMADEYDPDELVCGGCSDVAMAQMCTKHGSEFLEYKCRYCCSVAMYFCFGTTRFCNPCHDDVSRVGSIPKQSLPKCPVGPRATPTDLTECPLGVAHPPTGEEFALGCGMCRHLRTF